MSRPFSVNDQGARATAQTKHSVEATGFSSQCAKRDSFKLQLSGVGRVLTPLRDRARRDFQQRSQGDGTSGVVNGFFGSHSTDTLADCILQNKHANTFSRFNKQMHFSERVKEAIQGSGKTQSALAREVGVSQSAIAQWVSGNVKSLKAETATALELATGFRARWIVTGEGEKRVTEAGTELGSGWTVPLLPWSQTGPFATYESMIEACVEGWVGCPIAHSSDTFALRVQGASMHNPAAEASLTEGELIYVDPARRPSHGSLVIVRGERDEQAYFRQLLIDGGARYLQALNPNWPNRITQMSTDTRICGTVIGRLTEFPS